MLDCCAFEKKNDNNATLEETFTAIQQFVCKSRKQ